ncbi:hypothetical protein [Micromonospora noduli]|uniref:hypothetical protein n=1 Tax=Micromonospora noduli TaxID=709876 RepID=UPI000DDA8967|nr:hypothetical protein [Micromonospora noduli]
MAEAQGELAEEFVTMAAEYLKNGSVVAAASGYVFDELAPDRPEIAPLSILTDGEWSWPSDLSYYVQKYQVGLPEEFLQHAAARGWRVQKLTQEELEEIGENM